AVFAALLLELDLRWLEVRVVGADGLDELPVPRVARVGGHHVVVRHLLGARPGESKHDSHDALRLKGRAGLVAAPLLVKNLRGSAGLRPLDWPADRTRRRCPGPGSRG